MKKKWLIITMVCMVLLCIVVMVFLFTMGKKPYKNLDAAQIASAKVQLTPPDKTVEIEDISELVGYLNDVVIYNQDNSYTVFKRQTALSGKSGRRLGSSKSGLPTCSKRGKPPRSSRRNLPTLQIC